MKLKNLVGRCTALSTVHDDGLQPGHPDLIESSYLTVQR